MTYEQMEAMIAMEEEMYIASQNQNDILVIDKCSECGFWFHEQELVGEVCEFCFDRMGV